MEEKDKETAILSSCGLLFGYKVQNLNGSTNKWQGQSLQFKKKSWCVAHLSTLKRHYTDTSTTHIPLQKTECE